MKQKVSITLCTMP